MNGIPISFKAKGGENMQHTVNKSAFYIFLIADCLQLNLDY